MAKKGGSQALQYEINDDDEWAAMLNKDGLTLLDIYSGWCGPCIGMLGTLRKVKLEVGGEYISYAIAKSDKITDLERFRNKSEPTWMFVAHGQMMNMMFGSNAPRLSRMIYEEVRLEKLVAAGEHPRREGIAVTDTAPDEVIRQHEIDELKRIEDEIQHAIMVQKMEERRKMAAVILAENSADMGFILFWPHAAEAFGEMLQLYEDLHVIVQTFEKVSVKEEQLPELFYEVNMAITEADKAALLQGEATACVIKAKDDFKFAEMTMEEALTKAVKSGPGEKWKRLLVGAMDEEEDVTKEDALQDEKERCIAEVPKKETTDPGDETEDKSTEAPLKIEADDHEKGDGEKQTVDEGNKLLETTTEDNTCEEETVSKEKAKTSTEEPDGTEPSIIGIFTPNNALSKAMALNTFFHTLMEQWLPPEPAPTPPHLTVVFDSNKRRDVAEMCNEHPEYIMNIGFFTSSEPENAVLLSKSVEVYDKRQQTQGEKMIIQVVKKPSVGLLALAQLGPTYISPNVEVGAAECRVFFPPNYDILPDPEKELQDIREAKEREAAKAKAALEKKMKTPIEVNEEASADMTDPDAVVNGVDEAAPEENAIADEESSENSPTEKPPEDAASPTEETASKDADPA